MGFTLALLNKMKSYNQSIDEIVLKIDDVLKELDISLEKFLKIKIAGMILKVIDDDMQDNYLIIEGDGGCLTGDSLIRYNRGDNCRQITLKKLFNCYEKAKSKIGAEHKRLNLSIPTYIRSYNGEEIRLHKLKDVFYSGKKQTYNLLLEDEKNIKATSNHKFLTKTGWKELQQLTKEDFIMCDKPKPSKSIRKRIKLRDIGLNVGKNHPYNHKSNGQIEVHRLIYEARLNNLEFLEYLDILLNEPKRTKTLQFINPATHVIHHKDFCHYNNSIENLQLMTIEEHLKLHGKDNYNNFSQGKPIFIKIKEIREAEIEDTYDIECEEPYHNFVANDIVVHNSGKSNLSGLVGHIVAKITGRPFSHENLFFKTDEAIKFSTNTEKQIVIFDEPAFGGLKRDWQNKTQFHLIQLLFTARKKRHFVIFNLIKFNRFNRDIVEKAIGMIRIYKRNEQDKERRYLYFNKEKLIGLIDYAERKKYRAYNKFKIAFGSLPPFILHKIIDVEKYELSKDEAIASIGNVIDKKEEKHKEKEGLLQIKILNGYKRMKEEGIEITLENYCKYMDISKGTTTNWRENLKKLGFLPKEHKKNLEFSELIICNGDSDKKIE